MPHNYDFVVVGAGVSGAWTAYRLRLAGFQVALLDAYGPGNSRASSGGESRVIRMTYGPDELYTAWALRSLPAWKELAAQTNQELLHKTGVLWLSDGENEYSEQALATLKKLGIACSRLTSDEIRRNCPQVSFSNTTWGILEPESGVLMARQSVQALVHESVRHGVRYHLASVLVPSEPRKLQAIRTTAGETFAAGAFIFACGPWLPKLFPDLLAGRICSTRQEVFFLGTPSGDDSFDGTRMPVWLHHTHPNRPYALPDIANRGFKIAFDRHGPEFDPDCGSRLIGNESVAELRSYLKEHVPRLENAPVVETRVCQYENTWNGDFLIDHHPDCEDVWLVGGGSGHGFKHGPAVGEYVKGLIVDNLPAEPRFSLASKQMTGLRAVF